MKKFLITVLIVISLAGAVLYFSFPFCLNSGLATWELSKIDRQSGIKVADFIQQRSSNPNTYIGYFGADRKAFYGRAFNNDGDVSSENWLRRHTVNNLLKVAEAGIIVVHRPDEEARLNLNDVFLAPDTGHMGILVINNPHSSFYLAAQNNWPNQAEFALSAKQILHRSEELMAENDRLSELSRTDYVLKTLAEEFDLIYWYMPVEENDDAAVIARIREKQENGTINWDNPPRNLD